ncbi:MAG: hypothetical protein QG641_2739 [Candidatus Poribacteria bacterium]|nr:hypothetical protein [Candidatus Poribacteria bacterium]
MWLHKEIRQLLEPYDSDYNLTSVQQAKETFDTAIALLGELSDTRISDYAVDLNRHKEELIAPWELESHFSYSY